MKNLFLILGICISLSACSSSSDKMEDDFDNEFENLFENVEVPTYGTVVEYVSEENTEDNVQTSVFTWIPNEETMERVDLCPVRYFVSDGVLYSDQKYYSLFLSYSNEKSKRLSYQVAVYFNVNQESNADGWFSLDLKDADIDRIPGTYLSCVRMRNYTGEYVEGLEHYCWPDAILYNIAPEISLNVNRNMNSQVKRLLPYIK